MVSVLHKELEYKVERLKYKRLEVMPPEDQKQIRTFGWWINQREEPINFLRLKRGRLLEIGDLFERGVCVCVCVCVCGGGGGGWGADLIEDLKYSKAQ